MKIYNNSNLVKGWFIGNFEPTCFNTDACEVAFKEYKAGYCEGSHHHKVATEITYVQEGVVSFNGNLFSNGHIIIVEPNESVEFISVTSSKTIVIKIPGASNDKYID